MGKTLFEINLSTSGSGIIERRASVIATAAKQESEKFIQELNQQINKLDMQEITLNDFGPDDANSLRPASKDFNPEKWVNENNTLAEQRQILEIRLANAQKIHDKYFKEVTNG